MSQKQIWNNLYKSNLSWHFESKLPSICKCKKVLELGVGTGKTLKSILRQNPKEIYAIDFSEEAISICKSNFKNISKNIIKSNIISLPFKKRYFDIVVCYFILNNLDKKERKIAVNEIRRVLKEKGIILFEDFLEGDYRQNSFNKEEISKTGRYCHFFNKEEIINLFSKFKIKRLKIKENNPIRKDKKLKRKYIFLLAS